MKNVFTKSVIAASLFSAFAATAGVVDVTNVTPAFESAPTSTTAASYVDTDAKGTVTGSFLIASELIDNATNTANGLISRTVALSDTLGVRRIAYYSPVDLKSKSTLIFTATGGYFEANNSLKLARVVEKDFSVAQDGSDMRDVWDVVGTVTDFVKPAGADGYSSVKFQLTEGITGDQVSANDVLYIVKNADDTEVSAGVASQSPTVILASGSSALTVAVTEVRDDNAQLLNAPVASAETVVEKATQFTVAVTKNTDKIDVDLDRLGFTAATTADDGDSKTSFGTVVLTSGFSTAANKGVVLANYDYTHSIAGTQEAITDIAGFTYDEDDNVWTTAAAALTAFGTDTVTATVDGETEVEEAVYPLTTTVAAEAAAGVYGATKAFTLVNGSNVLDWKLNAATATIPYMPFATNVNQVIYLTNKGTAEGRIFVDVWAQDGEKVVSNVQLTGNTIPNGISFLTKQIQDLVAGKVENEKVTIKVIAEIPQDEMEVFSAFNVGGTDRGLVINDSNTTTNRQ